MFDLDLDLASATGRADFLETLGPKDRGAAPARPSANAIKRGELAEFPRVAEDGPAVIARAEDCHLGLRPQDAFHAVLIDQMAVTTIRLERCGRAERRLRDRAVMRAEVSWDDDRAIEAEARGALIREAPAAIVKQLRATPHGCDWLIRRWALLGRVAGRGAEWTAAQVALAHDLLGTPPEFRDGEPSRVPAGPGAVASPADRAELARREVDGLKRRKAEVLPLDAADRAMAEADYPVEPTAELRRLGRYEASHRRWLRWLVGQVRLDPPKRSGNHDVWPELPRAEADDKPDAPAPAPAPAAEVRVEPGADDAADEPSDRPAPAPRIPAGVRKDARTIQEEIRREFGQRERLRT